MARARRYTPCVSPILVSLRTTALAHAVPTPCACLPMRRRQPTPRYDDSRAAAALRKAIADFNDECDRVEMNTVRA